MRVTLPCWYLTLGGDSGPWKRHNSTVFGWLWKKAAVKVCGLFENHFELPYLDLFSPVMPELSPALGTSGETCVYIYIYFFFFFQSIPKQQRKSPVKSFSSSKAWANACLRTHSEEAAPTLEVSILGVIGSVIFRCFPTAVCCLMWGFLLNFLGVDRGGCGNDFQFWDETTLWLSKFNELSPLLSELYLSFGL